MTSYRRGDVVLVRFIFTNESGAKHRPVLIISTDAYHQGRQEAIVAAITSNISRLLVGDYLVTDWKAAGLLYPSVVTGIIRTIKQDMIDKKLGVMPATDMQAIENIIRTVLGL